MTTNPCMTLSIENENQDKSSLCEKSWRNKLPPLLIDFLKTNGHLPESSTSHIEMSVHLCSEERIQELNKSYRNKDKPTDVLTFPLFDDLRRPEYWDELPVLELGDIFICVNVAKIQAEERSISLESEILHLFVHGFLHIIGYDHERSDSEEKEMFDLEEELVKQALKLIPV